MRTNQLIIALGLTLASAGCKQASTPPVGEAGQEIAWRDGDVDDALAEAKESGKPVILYWGAKWCPPCNQMKSTLFKDPGFIAETRNFVPVYLDGDSAGAQRWGEQFGIIGYPTVIVLRPDGTEVTRLSSAATAEKFAQLLHLTATRTITTEALLERAERDTASLSADDWHLLADFDWQNDPKHFGDTARAGALLGKLAAAAPDEAARRRFALLALVMTSEAGPDGKLALTPAQQASVQSLLPAILANGEELTANRQALIGAGGDLVAALPDASKRAALGASLIAAMDKLQGDTRLSLAERLDTVSADVALAKAKDGTVPSAVLAKVRERVSWADKSAKDAMTRQSVMSDAGELLAAAGDLEGARKLLEAELKRSASPYYYMLDLATLAEQAGDKKAAINWARKALDEAKGPATRVQWAISYSNLVLRVAPQDKALVERSATAVLDELAKNPDSYFQRTRVKVTAWGGKLHAWSDKQGGEAVLGRLQAKMAEICAKEKSAAESCRAALTTA